MTDHPVGSGEARRIGVLRGCTLEVLPTGLWQARANLIVAGVYARDGSPMLLRGLEKALGSTFGGLRRAGLFSGDLGETLLLSNLAPPVRAAAVLILGLGASGAASPDAVRRAARAAAAQAKRMQTAHVASRCEGDGGARSSGLASPHLAALIAGLADVFGAGPHRIRRWSFLTRDADVEASLDRYRNALDLFKYGTPSPE